MEKVQISKRYLVRSINIPRAQREAVLANRRLIMATPQMQVGDIYYYNARWYDPQLGRFMQADTIVPTHQGTQGFDRYAYVNNNPLRYTDSRGNGIDDFF